MNEELIITVKTLYGLEDSLAEELNELGYADLETLNRAVQLKGTWEDVYRLNFYLRIAISVLVQVDQFYIQTADDLYKKAKKIAWEDFFEVDKTFAVKGAVFSTIFNHTSYPYLVVKDAIVDRFREKTGERPNVNPSSPQVLFDVYIKEKQVTLSLNTSGLPLYQRGYRQQTGEAPINEVLAAGLIRLSGWDKKSTFIDPMCGSGTIAIEAALMAADIPAMIEREHYAFKNFKSYNEDLWNSIYQSASRRPKDLGFSIFASDSDAGVLQKAKRNASNAPIGRMIHFQLNDFTEVQKPEDDGVLIVNPPYGERMGDEINELYESLGDFFKQKMTGFDCWIISSNLDAIKSVGLKPSKKYTLFNGKLECTFRKYVIFEGSLKEMKADYEGSEERNPKQDFKSNDDDSRKRDRKRKPSQKEVFKTTNNETKYTLKEKTRKESPKVSDADSKATEDESKKVKNDEQVSQKKPTIQKNKSKLDQLKKYRKREE